ncbi:hypothetical protein [Candidatus Lariskella endosymbiont of Epinotia ramella]|uniref:hypothetical protein n=1 Tax=Candidatus Lariskella endosymbiont of Epinotia ramella TaxID=3066224 RepID=UPI0030D4F881
MKKISIKKVSIVVIVLKIALLIVLLIKLFNYKPDVKQVKKVLEIKYSESL